MLDHETVFIKR